MNLTRTESDAFGPIEVPAQRLWGAQTQRSLHFFAISSERMPLALIHALVEIKRAAAISNQDLGLLAPEKSAAIVLAADEILAGRHDEEFPLSVWQTGSGTQSNMNVNEVLATRAAQLLGAPTGQARSVHPNDEVNRSQSSNDVFPSAMHLAASISLHQQLLPALHILHERLAEQAQRFAPIIKIGRTHLQDATPLSLGQEFSGYAAQIKLAEAAIRSALPALSQLALGGTAVGTGLNSHPEFASKTCQLISMRVGIAFVPASNPFAALAGHEAIVFAHGALKTLACALMKIANDIRWLASGPRAGLGEISLPENEPGSSIMPGKVNPTQCEALTMLCCQVLGNDVALSVGGASGNFELNVFKPMIAHNLMQSIRLLSDGMASFEAHCLRGIVANEARIQSLLEQSLMLVTALAPHIGYDKAAAIAKHAHLHGSSLRDAALSLGSISAADFDRLVVAHDMIHPA